jgi:predicted O-methyltransferase YrrM
MINTLPELRSDGALALAVASAIGRRQLRRMRSSGLPQVLIEPLEFLVARSLTTADAHIVEVVERFRTDMKKRDHELVGVYSNAQSESDVASFWTLREVAQISSVHPVWGAFLFLCAKASKAEMILELGGAAGISGCYLASSTTCRRFVTIEGSESRAKLARHHLAQVAPHAEVMVDSFQCGLMRMLPTLVGGLDLVFIDGSKKLDDNLEVLDWIRPYLNAGALVIFDDIHWSREMRQMWDRICVMRGIAHAVNVGRMGVCTWQGGEVRPQIHTLFEILGLDVYGAKSRLRSLIPMLRPPSHKNTVQDSYT